MERETITKVLVPLLTAVIGAVGALWVSQSEVFSKHEVDLKKLNEQLFLENRITAYIDYMKSPTEEGRYRLILLGSSNVLRSMGNIYTNFCQNSEPGECENTCEANKAFVKLYQAMRTDFQITNKDYAPDNDIYKARYERTPSC